MKYLSGFALVALVSCATCAQSCEALTLPPTLSSYAQRAEEIAVVKITNVSNPPGSPSGASCGKLYSATVLRNYKGSRKQISFFSHASKNYIGLNRDYFIVAIPIPRKGHGSEMVDNSLDKQCRKIHARYWVPWDGILMFPLHVERTRDWILTAGFSPLFLGVFPSKKIYVNMVCYAAVPLNDAVALVKAAEAGDNALIDYLHKNYPLQDAHYMLADPCGWGAAHVERQYVQ